MVLVGYGNNYLWWRNKNTCCWIKAKIATAKISEKRRRKGDVRGVLIFI